MMRQIRHNMNCFPSHIIFVLYEEKHKKEGRKEEREEPKYYVSKGTIHKQNTKHTRAQCPCSQTQNTKKQLPTGKKESVGSEFCSFQKVQSTASMANSDERRKCNVPVCMHNKTKQQQYINMKKRKEKGCHKKEQREPRTLLLCMSSFSAQTMSKHNETKREARRKQTKCC